MPRKELPKGVRKRTLKNGSVVYDALVYEKRKQILLGVCDTVSEAEALRHAYFHCRVEEGESIPHDTGILTLRELGHLYLDTLSPVALKTNKSRWKARVADLAEFIDWPLSQIDENHVRIWVDRMCETPIATGKSAGELPGRTTVQSSIDLLRAAFRWAAMPRQGYVTTNPVANVTIKSSTTTKPKGTKWLFDYLREDEAKKLMETDVLGLEPKTKFLVLMFSGARPSDVWRLEWQRIDWSAETVEFGNKKTGRPYVVNMLPQLAAALREWWLASGRRQRGLVFPSGATDEVYADGYDAGWADKKERRHWSWRVKGEREHTRDAAGEHRHNKKEHVAVTPGYRTKVGIRRPVPLYALKHTLACHLLLGTPLFTGGRRWSREEIQSQLGHKSSKATERYMLALGLASRRAAEESREALKSARRR